MTEDYENLPERELANRAAGGDDAAFGEIVRRFSPRVFRVSARFFRSEGLVEEAAQEIFLKAFTRIGSFEGRGSMEGWLTRVAVTTCINLTRVAKRQPELSISDLTDEENNWLEEKIYNASTENYRNEEDKLVAADLVNRVLATLPPKDVLVLTLVDGEGESLKEVAKATGWSESRVKGKAFRARKRFREALQKLLKEGDEKFFKVEK
ncbi:MAG: RNA polymerase sigma factor [Pyrinomonadaceae bacterium]